MKVLKLSLIASLAGGVLLGCSGRQDPNAGSNTARPEAAQTMPQAQTSPKTTDGNTAEHDHAAETAVTRISITEAQAAANRGDAVFLDVRQLEAYRTGHIKGAIPMPEAEIVSRAGTLPKDKKIITYCS